MSARQKNAFLQTRADCLNRASDMDRGMDRMKPAGRSFGWAAIYGLKEAAVFLSACSTPASCRAAEQELKNAISKASEQFKLSAPSNYSYRAGRLEALKVALELLNRRLNRGKKLNKKTTKNQKRR